MSTSYIGDLLSELRARRAKHPTRADSCEEDLLCAWELRHHNEEDHPFCRPDIPLTYHEVDGGALAQRYAGYRAEVTLLPPSGEPLPGVHRNPFPPDHPAYESWSERQRQWQDHVGLPWQMALPGEVKPRKVLRACAWDERSPETYLDLSWDPATGWDRYAMTDKMSDYTLAKLRELLATLQGNQRPAAHRPLGSGAYKTGAEFHDAARAAYRRLQPDLTDRTRRPLTRAAVSAEMGIHLATFYRYMQKWPLQWPPLE